METFSLYIMISSTCALILLMLSIRLAGSTFLQDQRRALLVVVIANLAFVVVDAVWAFFNYCSPVLTIEGNWILNMTYYVASAPMGYSWFVYSEAKQHSRYSTSGLARVVSAFPIVVLIVLILSSVATGWMFSIDAGGTYHRGPAYPLQLLIAYGYPLFTTVRAFLHSLDATDYAQKTELQILASYMLLPSAACIFQLAFPLYPITCVGNTLALLFVYLNLQEQMISLDPLTRLNNRNQVLQYLSSKFAHIDERKRLTLLLMDIDYFKSINDKYGHLEGDNALKDLASCLRKVSFGKHYFIARFGGDEFILACELEPTQNASAICEAIHSELKNVELPYPLSVSIGCAEYEPGMRSQQDLIARADAELYKVKESRGTTR